VEFLLTRAVGDSALGRQSAFARHAEAWASSGRLALALETLQRHLVAETGRNLGRAALRGAPGWQRDMSRLLLSDGVIELTRQVNPGLHRLLLRQLVQNPAPGAARV